MRYSGNTAPSSSSCFSRNSSLSRSEKPMPFVASRFTTGYFAMYSSSIHASCESNCRSRQYFLFLLGLQRVGRRKRQFEPRLAKFSAGVFFDLRREQGNDIERRVH